MECGEDKVTRFGRIHGGFGCFGISGLTNQDDVGVLTQKGAQKIRKSLSFGADNRELLDVPTKVIFDGIFRRNDIQFAGVFLRSAEAKVVDFPEPVGPETMMIPLASLMIDLKSCRTVSLEISVSRLSMSALLFRNLITIFSPNLPGAVAQRNSMVWPSNFRRIFPSCDCRRSAISICAIFFRQAVNLIPADLGMLT